MNKYTVVLLKPDYSTGDYSQNTYTAYVDALDLNSAKKYANIAAAMHDYDHNGNPVKGKAEDYLVLCVFDGFVTNINEVVEA